MKILRTLLLLDQKLSNALEYICSTDDYTILLLNGLGYGGDGMGAFEGCYSLENIVFPSNNLKEIQGYSFANCSKLSSIVLPETLRRAGAFAFYNCEGLQDITINGPTYIGGAAFAEPQKLNSLILNNEKITEFSQKAQYLGFCQIDGDLKISSDTIKTSTYQFPITLNHWKKVCELAIGDQIKINNVKVSQIINIEKQAATKYTFAYKLTLA